MLFLKNKSRFLLGPGLILSSFWIYQIIGQNLLVGILVFFITLLFLYKPEKKIVFVGMTILLLLQFQTTQIKNLTYLDNDQQRVQQERIRSYPPTFINLLVKVIWLKPQIWIEQNPVILVLSRVEENLFDTLDINKYFFSGFPRNNPSDFPKFSFLFLPFFVIGVFGLVNKGNYKQLMFLFLIPLILFSVIGKDNKFGPFSLFPFFILTIHSGFNLVKNNLKTSLKND